MKLSGAFGSVLCTFLKGRRDLLGITPVALNQDGSYDANSWFFRCNFLDSGAEGITFGGRSCPR